MSQARISRIGQVMVYTGKCFRVFMNEKGWKTFISSAIIAIVITWVIGGDMFVKPGDTRSGAFALICACIWIGVFNSIRSVCRERAIIKREHRTGLRISSYIAARMIYEMAISLIQALIMIIILVSVPGFPSQGIIFAAFFEIYITFFLAIYASDVLGIAVSCVVKTENAAMTAMPFVLIIQLVLCGVIFQLEGAASAIANLTISKWGVNAIGSTANINQMLRSEGLPVSMDYDFTAGHISRLWLTLAVFAIVYGIIGTVILKLTIDKDKR